jgi:hypothetical protein
MPSLYKLGETVMLGAKNAILIPWTADAVSPLGRS